MNKLSEFMELIVLCTVIVLILFLIYWFTKIEFFGAMAFLMIVTGPILLPVTFNAFKHGDMEKEVVKIFGEDIKKEYVKDENKLIVKSKEGIYEVYYDENKKIDLIKNITKNMQDEEKQREKTKEILKNL